MPSYWDPFAEMSRLQDQLFGRRGEATPAVYRPPVDIREEDRAFLLYVELPGLKAENVQIDVEKGVLTIKGERSLAAMDEDAGWRRVERPHGTFTRTFSLPESVDPDAIEARMEDGVLTVRIPKREVATPRKITVQAA